MKEISNPYGLSSELDKYRVAVRSSVSILALRTAADEYEARHVVINAMRENIAESLLHRNMMVSDDPASFMRTYVLDGYFLTREDLNAIITREAHRLMHNTQHMHIGPTVRDTP